MVSLHSTTMFLIRSWLFPSIGRCFGMYIHDLIKKPLGQVCGSLIWHLRGRKKNLFRLILFFSWETEYLRLHLKSMNHVPSLRNKCLKNDKIVSSTPLTGLTMFEEESQVTTMKIQRKLQTVMGIYIKLDPSWTGKMHEKMEIRNNSASHSSLQGHILKYP